MKFDIDAIKNINLDKVVELLKDEEKRNYIVLGSAALFALIYLLVFIFPLSNNLFQVSRSIREINNNMELVTSRLSRMDQMKKKLELLRKDYSEYGKQLPSEKEMPRFLQELAETARDSNVKIISVTPMEVTSPSEEKGKEYYRSIPITITAKGGYHQLGYFISSLEHGGRYITLQDLKLNYSSDTPRAHNIKMVLKAYVSVDEKKTEKK